MHGCAYYNEYDTKAAAWLRELIRGGHIAPGDVDERSIELVQPADLAGYAQVHLFAGIGGWSRALRLADWPDDRPVWTGSCPCQPFSSAGKRKGGADHRHLWPEMFRLIRERRPDVVFGEQVAASSVVGRTARADAKVQEMWDREAVFRVLCELKGQSPTHLQGLQAGDGKRKKAGRSHSHRRQAPGMAQQKPGLCTGECRQASSEEAGHRVQSGCAGNSVADRCGVLRVDWNSVQSDYAEGLERALIGPDRFQRGLYDGQCAGCPLCIECDGEHLGTAEDFGDCIGDFSESQDAIERLIRANRPRPSENDRPVWLDGICDDLELEGYAVGAIVLPACSVGSPQIRQRLWWVGRLENASRAGLSSERKTHEWASGSNRVGASGAVVRLGSATSGGNGSAKVGGSDSQSEDQGRVGVTGGSVATGRLALPNGPELQRITPAGEQSVDEQDEGTMRLEHSPRDGRGPRRAESDGRSAASGCGAGGVGNSALPPTARQRQLTEHVSGAAGTRPGPGFWSDYELIPCRDGRLRRTQPGLFPLAPRLPHRVALLRGIGNSIVPECAAAFIKATQA